MTYALIISAALGAILLFLLAVASANTSLFAQHYPLLLILNGVTATALVGLVGYQLWRLRGALRAKVFGSRLTLRLLVLFVVMAIVPGALVYTVSLQFLAKSIESWFDVRVDAALESGLSLGRDALDAMLEELRATWTTGSAMGKTHPTPDQRISKVNALIKSPPAAASAAQQKRFDAALGPIIAK